MKKTFFLLLLCVFTSCSAVRGTEPALTPVSPQAPTQAKNPPAQAEARRSDLEREKSYVLPAAEIVGFQLLLNLFDRNFAPGKEDYRSDLHSIHENLNSPWKFDRDGFSINQIGHPYQGSISYNLARSSGLNFWESLGYTTVGSGLWEIAGETTKPSLNDQITTSLGGSFLGEAFYRSAESLWSLGKRNFSTSAGKAAAAIASPAADLNNALGRDTKNDLEEQSPPLLMQFGLGYLNNVDIFNAYDSPSHESLAGFNFQIDYGLPGRRGYEYRKPFDYYSLDLALNSSPNDPLGRLIVNGLLFGEEYTAGSDYRGIYGLYANYNYIAPEIFRVASSGLSLGTTGQWWLGKRIALQNSLLGGVGFGAAGSVGQTDGTKEYHYGAVPQGLAAIRLIAYNRLLFECSGQEFFVTGSGSDAGGEENVSRLSLALTARVYGPNAIGLQFSEARRNASISSSPDQHQRVDTLGVFYTLVWGQNLGAIDWREERRPLERSERFERKGRDE